MNRALLILLCAGLLVTVHLTGCTIVGPDPDRAAVSIRTDQSAYHPGDDISVVIRNDSPSPIYYNTCLEVVLEGVGVDGVAQEWGFPVCECLCYATLEPESEFGASVHLESRESFPESYSYRLRYLLHRDAARTELLDQRWSNSFTIRAR